jgi:subtilisin family serine protease
VADPVTHPVDGDVAPPAAPSYARPAWVTDDLRGATGAGVRVAVVDSGWDRACADPRVLPGVGFVDPGNDFGYLRSDDDGDRSGHGTGAINQVLALAPGARVLPVRVFGERLETSPRALCEGLAWAIEQRVDVVNLSIGTVRDDLLRPLYRLCEQARRAGTMIVAAGSGEAEPGYPAVFDGVIGVAAARFASPFEYRYRPDDALECEAWGIRQPVAGLGGRARIASGGSVAAPNVTGIVALFLERHPGATLEQVRTLLARYAVA